MTRIKYPALFCARHWSLVPTKMQLEIGDAWGRGAEGLTALLSQAKDSIAKAEKEMSTWSI